MSSDEVYLTPDSSPELTKRSWFGNLMTTEKDETFTVLVKGKPLATVKAHLIHAFLSVRIFSHQEQIFDRKKNERNEKYSLLHCVFSDGRTVA